MQKRAQLYYRSDCKSCLDAKDFMEDHGVLVVVRDIEKKPLTKKEISSIVGYLDPKHYVDPSAPGFSENKLDQHMPSREELLKIISENQDMLRIPIIVSGRLKIIGSGRKQIIDMLQLSVSDNGNGTRSGNGSSRK